jgi:putative metallohydrolase (TIGR04338 family)
MSATRDSQRGGVYEAESLVRRLFDRADSTGDRGLNLHGSHVVLPIERRFASIDSVQRYTDLVLALRWVTRRWPQRSAIRVSVRERAGQARAHYDRLAASIAIPPYSQNRSWAMREFVVLHEIAHHLAPEAEAPAHGPGFVVRFIGLVDEIIGPEAALVLRTAMHEAGVAATAAHGVGI